MQQLASRKNKILREIIGISERFVDGFDENQRGKNFEGRPTTVTREMGGRRRDAIPEASEKEQWHAQYTAAAGDFVKYSLGKAAERVGLKHRIRQIGSQTR